MPTRCTPLLQQALLTELQANWMRLNRDLFRGALRQPALQLHEGERVLGHWQRQTRTLSMGRVWITIAPWGQVIEVQHSLSEPGVVIINQNHWPGWSCGDRPLHKQTVSELGVLAFSAPAGMAGKTTCRWRPPRLAAGAAGSGLGLLALLALWPWRRRQG